LTEGIGVDLVSIERIRKALYLREKKFLSRVCSDEEYQIIQEIKSKNVRRSIQKIAGFFAAKEAFLKAVGGGLFSIPFKNISILNEKSGKPYVKIDGGLKDLIYKKFKKRFDVVNLSITHESGFACAFVVIERL